MEFMCYYCVDHRFSTLKDTVGHNIEAHSSERLKLRQLVLNEQTGKKQFVSVDFRVIPSNISESGQEIEVDERNFKISIKTKKCENQCDSEGTDSTRDDPDPEIVRLFAILPTAARRLKEQGLLSTWLTLHELISEGTFPLNNICFLLFLDVVHFFSQENTSLMRYQEATKMFWRTGYRLFHGKFLRFMGGPKNQGDIVEGTDEPGTCKSVNAKINFAIPNVKHLEATEIAKETLQPGILPDSINILAQTAKIVKVAFDAKKINSSLSHNLGDVDLFGHEDSPTLAERQERKLKELDALDVMLKKAEADQLAPTDLHSAALTISERIRELREQAVFKYEGVKKFMELGQPDWRASKYSFVISSLQSSLFEIKETVNRSLEVNNRLCQIAARMQGAEDLFQVGPNIKLDQQKNYVCITEAKGDEFDRIGTSTNIERCVLKQRSPQWFEVRKTAKVTGSTAHKALGLKTFKDQLRHVDRLTGCAGPEEDISPQLQKYLEHGSANEIHAAATLVGKVLPAYYPHHVFVEEGCSVLITEGQSLLVVSPDGSIRADAYTNASLAVELKCPFGEKKYTTQVHYKMPEYYAVQVMCEMATLQCKELIFLSYTEESSTVFKADFSEQLWEHLLQELVFLYGADSARKPSKLRQESKTLREEIKDFAKNNVHFVCELPSARGQNCSHEPEEKPVFQSHKREPTDNTCHQQPCVEHILFTAQSVVKEAHELCRKRATEIMVFMMSDLDRIANFGCGHSLPVAYGLQGPSIKTDAAKGMLREVLEAADAQGLKPLVFSSDGQFINLITKDLDGKPLTMLQLQKEHWDKTRKMSKPELVSFFKDLNVGAATFSNVALKQRHVALLEISSKTKEPVHKEDCDLAARVEHLLPINLGEKVDKDTFDEIVQVISSLVEDEQSGRDSAASAQPGGQCDDGEGSAQLEETQSTKIVLQENHLQAILLALQSQNKATNVNKWKSMNTEDFRDIFSSTDSVDKQFSKDELKTCCRVLKTTHPAETKKLRISMPKWQMLAELSQLLCLHAPTGSRRKAKTCMKLKQLAYKTVKNLPKAFLCAVYAELTFSEAEKTWKASFPFASSSKVSDEDTITWFSYPAMRTLSQSTRQLPLFGVCDSHHILTNLRCKCCSSGITPCGVHRDAWIRVAKNGRENKAGLSMAHVEELIDKQSSAYAQLTFSEKVEEEMLKNNDTVEATFCRLVRQWYQAEDSPGQDSHDRLLARLRMRSWLLDKYKPSHFPPQSSYVRGIPIVTFQALLTNIERKIQLYSVVDSYNPRAVSTLDSENFFSILGDLAPGGKGLSVRPADIPAAMATACNMAKLHCDPDRPFHLHTTRAPVYPKVELVEASAVLPSTSQDESDRVLNDMSTIALRNHPFDLSNRRRRRGKRKSSSVSAPHESSKGAKGGRQFHKVDETKILPHIRLGIELK